MYTSTDADPSDPVRRIGSDGWARIAVPALALLLILTVGCGGGEGSTDDSTDASSQENAAQAPASGEAETSQPETIGDIFPEGEGRVLVLNNCAGCHAVACAAIGQRSPSRWESLRESHREHIPAMSEEDLGTIFTYLQSNFDDSQPEPQIPSAFLQEGCTPF